MFTVYKMPKKLQKNIYINFGTSEKLKLNNKLKLI